MTKGSDVDNSGEINNTNNSFRRAILTSLACCGAACLRYPAELYAVQWKAKALSKWADENVQLKSQRSSVLILSAVTPFIRLFLHESLTFSLSSEAERQYEAFSSLENKNGSNRQKYFHFIPLNHDILAGSIAGICQAVLLCPLEEYRALARHVEEAELNKSWVRHWRQQIFEGGSSNPNERLYRAYRGVRLLAVREMIFNIAFFPLCTYVQRQQQQQKFPNLPWNQATTKEGNFFLQLSSNSPGLSSSFWNLVLSRIIAGTVCSIAVAPIDVLRLYFWHSSERWSIISGKCVSAPPLVLLSHGSIMQAIVYGTTFGVVASVYEWNTY